MWRAMKAMWNAHSFRKTMTWAATALPTMGTGRSPAKWNGTKITWSYDSEYEGTPLTVKYSGTIDSAAAKLSGAVSVEQFGVDGDFTAAVSK